MNLSQLTVDDDPVQPDTRAIARAALAEFRSATLEASGPLPWDPGVMILAAGAELEMKELEKVCLAWVMSFPQGGAFSLYAGNAGLVMGLRQAARVLPSIRASYTSVLGEVLKLAEQAPWHNPARDWHDYDLVTGPAGFLLATLPDESVPAYALEPAISHLVTMLQTPSMSAFRLTDCRDNEQRAWNHGIVNLGVAHGVPGVIAALVAYLRRFPRAESSYFETLESALEWLLAQAHDDVRGLATWAPGELGTTSRVHAASHREAWCYGAPTNAWILWDGAGIVGRRDFQQAAEIIFERYAAAFDPSFHLEADIAQHLAICHGAAGIMLIADTFAHHAGLKPARRLSDRMLELLGRHLTSIPTIMRSNPTMLSGGSGILAAIATINGGCRDWLPALALR